MFKKLTLAAAAGVGYVLGAKAGKERYHQIESKFREIAGMPAVQNATTTVKQTASDVADTAKSTVSDKVEQVTAKTSQSSDTVVDLGTGTGANTGATGPMSGAAASGSAPDVTRP